MKDDKLEKFISENRDEFDFYEPDPKVWERIIVNEEKPKVRQLNITKVLLQVAAVAVIIVASVYFVKLMRQDSVSETADNNANTEQHEIVIPELIEAETYYTTMVNNKMSQVRKFSAEYPDLEADIATDLSELDSICLDLKEDLRDNIDNEEIVNAMIRNYRLKLQILEDLLLFLEESQNETDNNETPRYEI